MSTPMHIPPFESAFIDIGLPMHAASWGSFEVTHVLVHGLGGAFHFSIGLF